MNIVTFSWHSETADSNEVSAGMRLAIPVLELMSLSEACSLSEDVARAFAAPRSLPIPVQIKRIIVGECP
jgi:hypothetical protein